MYSTYTNSVQTKGESAWTDSFFKAESRLSGLWLVSEGFFPVNLALIFRHYARINNVMYRECVGAVRD